MASVNAEAWAPAMAHDGQVTGADTPHSVLHPGRGAACTGIAQAGCEPWGVTGWADGGRAKIRRAILRTGWFVSYSFQIDCCGVSRDFIPERLNSTVPANPVCEPDPGGNRDQNIPHCPVYPAGFAGYITLGLINLRR